ncbi:MAG: hypothetical protein ACXWMU_06810, partial [Candidatus Limnocylindrales bacterium]
MTPDIDSLLSADADDGDRRSPAIIGGPWESDGSLALGFFKLADIAAEWWKAGHRNDAIVIPIIYNYRHGIELALKEEIREAAACLCRDGVAGPDVQADEVDQWLSGIHSIEQLVNRLTKLLGDPGRPQKTPRTRPERASIPLLSREDRPARPACPGAGTARPAAVRPR